MMRKKTHEEFVEEISIKNPDVEILDTYINSRIKIRCLCRVCGCEWKPLPTSLSRGMGCPSCGIKKLSKALRLNTQEFIERLSFVNPDIEVVSEYISTRDEIDCKCKVCGNTFKKKPMLLMRGQGCSICDRKRIRDAQLLSEDEFLRRISLVNPNVILLEEYNGRHQKILCYCTTHNRRWKTRPSELLDGCGCPDCYSEKIGNALRLSQEEIENKLKEVNPDVVLIGRYAGLQTNTECKCKKCGYVWKPRPGNLIYGNITGCPKCQSYSKGEDRVKRYLTDNDIEHKIHKTYKNLTGVGNKPLSYDFYLPKFNLLIEYQGRQHETPSTFGDMSIDVANKRFEIQQEHDKRKKEYAEKHNIDLLEIWYYDYNNIEQILKDKLHINNTEKSS